MIRKDKILEAWIMVEHLSEGDIRVSDTSVRTLEDLQGRDFHSLFRREMERKEFRPGQNGGIAVYFDIFDFQDVVSILREQYGLKPTHEELRSAKKFSFALYFDRDLNFLPDMMFFTESAYIRYFKKVPKAEEFREFEDNLKQQFTQDFDETAKAPEAFNAAVQKELRRYQISINTCRMQVLNNVETEGTNLHSFFINDLEKAKKIETANLRAYLYGTKAQRVNLDSKMDSAHFHPRAFEEILQPANYPLGRFPSNTAYALSLMQQAAVNLSIGADSQPMRSVNGPPGTGKTTLLKDIFAELIVRQAYDMAKLPEHCITGAEKTLSLDWVKIGVLPAQITENHIVAASSNNGAVQNIVNELPLCQGIDEALLEDLKEADYFRELSNAKLSVEWKEDENGKNQETLVCEPGEGEEKFWGIFSLEGGKADNMTNILTNIKHIHKYLEEEYLPDQGVYEAFLKEYEAVRARRARAQAAAESIRGRRDCAQKLSQARSSYEKEAPRKEKELAEAVRQVEEAGQECAQRLSQLLLRWESVKSEKAAVQRNISSLELYLKANRDQKPGFFAGRRKKEEYRDRLNEMTDQLLKLQGEDAAYAGQERGLRSEIARYQGEQKQRAEKRARLEKNLASWKRAEEGRISALEEKVREYERVLGTIRAEPLNMYQKYEELQLSNPWFDQAHRVAQSRLFLAALRVRKQFLYDNRRSLWMAAVIWGQQDKYLERPAMIEAAWNWINMAVPVISSTFASFGRMCKNLGPEALGHLFIDEGGQALPQAAVGAVYRSRHVMVVGDPSQIKPVLTLDSNTLGMLGGHFGVTEKYLSASASAQTLADAASRYGFYRKPDRSEESWIGIPLWVHRRCRYPMFTISNAISYGGLMVQGMENYGKTGWFDIGGKANNKYVREQGDFLAQKIQALMAQDPKIGDKAEKDVIYVVTPFSNVADQLSRRLEKIRFTRYDGKGKPTNVGTVHTFQGKEAPIVFFVLGADRQSSGAARWAMSEPNMMNVAATRAKKEFYIIGDKKLYLGLGCDVPSETGRIIRTYKEQHPELVEDAVVPAPAEEGTAAVEGPAFLPELLSPQSAPAPAPPPPAPGPRRVSGTVKLVRRGSSNFYAYVSGDDGIEYSIPERIYAVTERAAEVIQEAHRISFVPKKGASRPLATDVRPEIRSGP